MIKKCQEKQARDKYRNLLEEKKKTKYEKNQIREYVSRKETKVKKISKKLP